MPQVRDAFGASEPLPEHERDLLIYCSRSSASDRHVRNQDAILASMREAYPEHQLVVYDGSISVPDTIALFRRAKVVLGVHGAGLAHTIFTAPGTAVIEFLFLFDPPMMFWHASGAMGLKYHMLPLAQSWWLQKEVHVPEGDVLDSLALALGPGKGADECNPGALRACGAGGGRQGQRPA